MTALSSFAQFILSGATSGCVYTLVAIGIVLCASATNVINLAQGEFVMLGGLVGATCAIAGVPVPFAVLAAMATGAAIGGDSGAADDCSYSWRTGVLADYGNSGRCRLHSRRGAAVVG